MFKGVIKDYTTTANTNIAINPVKNTNSRISYNSTDNTIVFNEPGYYDITINAVATDFTVGEISLTEYLNGIASNYAISTVTTEATTDVKTYSISDVVTIYISPDISSKANVSFQFSANGTINNAIILVEGRR